MNQYLTLPAGEWQQTLVVQKSRFIAFCTRVENAAAAQEFLKKVALPDATHHCYAYIVTDGQKSNDNGEPAGTAGLPILQAIKSAGLTNVVVAVERYFGGIELGTGGLARAYGQAASQVLASVKPVRMCPGVVLSFTTSYEQQTLVQKLVEKFAGRAVLDYADCITWQVTLPMENQTAFTSELGSLLHTAPELQIVAPHVWIELPA